MLLFLGPRTELWEQYLVNRGFIPRDEPRSCGEYTPLHNSLYLCIIEDLVSGASPKEHSAPLVALVL